VRLDQQITKSINILDGVVGKPSKFDYYDALKLAIEILAGVKLPWYKKIFFTIKTLIGVLQKVIDGAEEVVEDLPDPS
jgi:hypothetical protein